MRNMKIILRVIAVLCLAQLCIGIDKPNVEFFGGCQSRPEVRYYDNTVQATPSYMTGAAQQQAEFGGIK